MGAKNRQDYSPGDLSFIPWNVLGQLSPEQFNALDQIAVTRQLDKNDFVFRPGENAGNVNFLKSGKVKVFHYATSGKEAILWFCFGGDIFGLAEAVQCGVREVGAQACEASVVISIPQDSFNAYLFEHPQVMFLLLQVMTSRLRCLSETLANVSGEQVQTRLARLLYWLCTRYGKYETDKVVIGVYLTHQEIADMIGATRQTVTSLMSNFKQQGILEIHDRFIHIIDKNRLCAI